MPAIGASREWRKRPTALIMADEYYGHRHSMTGRPHGDKDEWLPIDFILARAHDEIKAFTRSSGIFEWVHDDPEAEITAERRIDKFNAYVENVTKGTDKNPYKPVPGEGWVPHIESQREDGSLWGYRDWIKHLAEESENGED